jgi:putative DeoR family transcriptional regulator (stage III sporulation protein D)
MKQYIANRVHEIADYVLATGATVRQAGKHFAVSKSTVHKDLQQRLKELNLAKWHKVMAVLDCNFTQRHLRGGMATQQKYLKIRNQR